MTEQGIAVGAAAPGFALPDQNGRTVRLSDLAGSWVVLYFYPKDDTPGCTVEACEFSAGIAEFRGLDAVVLGCSPDSPASHRRFADKHGLELTLLSDPEAVVLRRYRAWGVKERSGRTREGVIRSTVLIDPEGTVACHWPSVKAAGHAAAVRDALAELKRRRA